MKKLTNVQRITVIVHPHYNPNPYLAESPVKTKQRVPVRKALIPLTQDNDEVKKHLEDMENLYRFYRTEITRIKQTPRHLLVLVTSKNDLKDYTYQNELHEWGLSEQNTRDIEAHSKTYQDRLARIARKLGRMAIITKVSATELEKAGEHIKDKFRERGLNAEGIPIQVFGESTDVCAATTHKSLLRSGFKSELIREKSTSGKYRRPY